MTLGNDYSGCVKLLTIFLTLSSCFGQQYGIDKDVGMETALWRDLITGISLNNNGQFLPSNDADRQKLPFQNPYKNDGTEHDKYKLNKFLDKTETLETKIIPPIEYRPDTIHQDSIKPKDTEYLSQNAVWGNQYISGGAGEGKQMLRPDGDEENKQEVKTDANLPAYCSPPNPCPKGFTAKDGCQENIPDTVRFNRRYNYMQMVRGSCSCDSEHMFDCPDGYGTVNAQRQPQDTNDDPIDNLIRSLLSDNEKQVDNPYATGVKRSSLVAKKHRSKRGTHSHEHVENHVKVKVQNPYLQGVHLGTVAKKGNWKS